MPTTLRVLIFTFTIKYLGAYLPGATPNGTQVKSILPSTFLKKNPLESIVLFPT